jgi:hypothetical protein
VTGNPEWLVPAGFEERRFAVLDVADTQMQKTAYFAAIDEEMENGGREALLHHLLNFNLGSVNLRAIPKTGALFEQQVASMDDKQSWWLDTLRRGELPCKPVTKDGEFSKCPSNFLYCDYLERSAKAGAKRKSMETALGMFLSKMVTELKKTKGMYHLPPLKRCREEFAALTHAVIAWDDPDGDWQARDDAM